MSSEFQRIPLSDGEWNGLSVDTVSVKRWVDRVQCCPECDRPMRIELRTFDPPRPPDDCFKAFCVVCSGLWDYFGRDVATNRSLLQNSYVIADLEAWLGPRWVWLDPFLN